MSFLSFEYRYKVTFGDTNAMQNLYFSRYFDIQGHVRELWLASAIKNYKSHHHGEGILSTRTASCDYKVPYYPFDDLICRMHFSKLRAVSATCVFEFYKEGNEKLCAVGKQELVFKDLNRKTRKIPEHFRIAIDRYLSHDGKL